MSDLLREHPATLAAPAVDPPTVPLGAGIDFTDPNSPLAPFYLRTTHVLAVGLLGLIFALTTQIPLWHTDVWGHMRYGQWMVEHRAIPDREPFCPWWDGRVPFTQFYTLTQLVMYGVYAAGAKLAGGDDIQQMAGGIATLQMLYAGLTTARFAVLLLVFLRASRAWPFALIGILAVLFLDWWNLRVFRPQTFAELGFALLLLPLTRDVLSRRAVALIPLLCVVWANGHGSYVVAFTLLAAVLLGRLVEIAAFAGARVAPWRDPHSIRLALALGLSILAVGLLNPYGFDLFKRTAQLAAHPSLIAGVSEWMPMEFKWRMDSHWIYMSSLVAIALTQLASPRPLPMRHVTVLLLFGCGVALQTRFEIWWSMLVPWVLAPRWAELTADWRPEPSVPSLRKTAIAASLAWALFMWSTAAWWLIDGHPQQLWASASSGTPWRLAWQIQHPNLDWQTITPDDPDAEWMPGLTAVMRENYPRGRFTGTVLASPMQGDYLMWALAPDVPVTYAHMHLFHPDYWNELGIVGQGRPGWVDALDKYRANLVVLEAEHCGGLRKVMQRSKEWKIVLDEEGEAGKKPEEKNRQFIAIRIHPL